ncbi:hypothetical protein GCM10008961_20510 [Deinococcus knuensis]|uniref:Uncharacterized protein n=1 Tax=Deinococcus knuensis TaxID=1837380 RepID=A0ABQ2SHE8_9DEIO|nr:hypothetical protein GCM10008961_20510 [Deinococcus knuensis]
MLDWVLGRVLAWVLDCVLGAGLPRAAARGILRGPRVRRPAYE